MKVFGITGGTGSGKTYISEIAEKEFGVVIYNCDRATQEIMQNDPQVIANVKDAFGEVYEEIQTNSDIIKEIIFPCTTAKFFGTDNSSNLTKQMELSND